ncbi:hypothetical protein BJ166DRAFT_532396 [Pestalotiopsis sp. NC0098]|nr:hypothetical protein BJ166DRAFT_532396 [Pestalotiopsis sp. NC0098]
MLFTKQLATLSILAIAQGVASQNASATTTTITPIMVVGAMPQCAQMCIVSGIEAASCSMTDLASFSDCICLNVGLQSDFNKCVQDSCASMTDWGTALGVEGLLCEAYPKEDRTSVPLISAIVGIAIVVPCVAARLASRLRYTGRLWPDDWVMIFTAVVFLGLAAILIVSARLGLGVHFWNMKIENAIPLMQIFFASQVMYIVVTFAGKLAILLLYQRIFDIGSKKIFGRVIKVCIVLQCLDSLTYLCLIVLECIPISAVWDKSITNPKCLDLHAISVAGAISSMATDVILMLLPMPVLWTLQVSRMKRIGLVFIFAVASLGIVASAVRFSYLIKLNGDTDETWNNVDVTVWSLIEILCTVVCGSIPAMRPLLSRAVPSVNLSVSWQRRSKGSNQYVKASNPSTGTSQSSQSRNRSYEPKSDIWLESLPPTTIQGPWKAPVRQTPTPRHAESQDRLFKEYEV